MKVVKTLTNGISPTKCNVVEDFRRQHLAQNWTGLWEGEEEEVPLRLLSYTVQNVQFCVTVSIPEGETKEQDIAVQTSITSNCQCVRVVCEPWLPLDCQVLVPSADDFVRDTSDGGRLIDWEGASCNHGNNQLSLSWPPSDTCCVLLTPSQCAAVLPELQGLAFSFMVISSPSHL